MAIKGLIGSSKRVLSGTKSVEKIKAIKEGVAILEDFLEKFDRENRSKLNLAYLPHSLIVAVSKPKDALAIEFADVYGGRAKGNYKHLRTLYPEDDDTFTWDIVRNKKVNEVKEKIAKNNLKLFENDGAPTKEHLTMIHWAYSPQIDKLKAFVDKQSKGTKRKSTTSASEDEEVDKSKEKKEENSSKKSKVK